MIIFLIVGNVCLPNRSLWVLKLDKYLIMASLGQGGVKMYAIIETGGKQFRVSEGDILNVEKIEAEQGSVIDIDKVLAVVKDGEVVLGKPYVEGAKAQIKVLEHGKGDKILVFKYKPKKKYRRTQGHRQPYTKVVVEKIEA